MKRASTQDRKVQEVKAILEGLQRYSTGEETSTPATEAPRQMPQPTVVLISAAVAVVAIVAIGGTYIFSQPNKRAAAPLSVVPKVLPSAAKKPADPTLEAAMTLLGTGRVRSAREQLSVLADKESADAAWALARSYDPNYLRTLGGADASPDVKEATRWYRAWYAVAVKQGLVADSVSLERIIKSME